MGAGIDLLAARVLALGGEESYRFQPGDGLEVALELDLKSPMALRTTVGISDGRTDMLIQCSMLEDDQPMRLGRGRHEVRCRIPGLPLAPRSYDIWAGVWDGTGVAEIVDWSHVASFRVVEEAKGTPHAPGARSVPWVAGPIRMPYSWSTESS
jgi:hypothetical protein